MINAHKERQALTLTRFPCRTAGNERARVAGAASRTPSAPADRAWYRSLQQPRTVRQRGFDATASMARTRGASSPRAIPDDGSIGRWSRLVASPIRPVWAQRPGRRIWLALSGCGRPITAGAVVLVDDLVTTGSSLTEAARVLRAARIPVLGAATVAPPYAYGLRAPQRMFAD